MVEKDKPSDVVERIQQANLSPSQRKVTQYLLEGGLAVVHYTIAQIAEAVEVNPSTVVRTAQSLGYPGFPDFQEALRNRLLRQARLSQRIQITPTTFPGDGDEAEGERHILDQVLSEEIQHMLDMPQHIAYDTFDAVVDVLDAAEHVYIIGLGASFSVALNFGTIIRYTRKNVVVLKPGIDPIAAQVTDIEADDVLVAVCFARYTRETLLTMNHAREKGVQVVAITDSLVSPPARRADLTLVVSYRFHLYGNAVAVFTLLDALAGALFQRNPERSRVRLEQLEDLYKSFHLLTDENDT